MRKSLFTFLILMFLIGAAYAGVISNSPYDNVWDIKVTDCHSKTVFYKNCVITNLDEWSLSFIPDQGRIPSGNGKEVIVYRNSCTSVTLTQK